MSRKKIRIQYIRPAVGHPDPPAIVRVELTEQVQALLDQGIAVDLGDDHTQVPAELAQDEPQPVSEPVVPNDDGDPREPDSGHLNGPADPPTNPDEQTSPDGSTVLPARKTPAKKGARPHAS